jgi:hypothetical protein
MGKGAPEPPIRRSDVAAATVRVLNRGNTWNPDVSLVETASGPVVVKDFANRGPLVRAVAPLVLSWEIRAYRALGEHARVPHYLGRVDALAFAQEYRPCRPVTRRLAPSLPPGFADELERDVRRMHALGVVHLDLRHRSNVMVGDDGSPVLIDFGSSLCFRPGGLAARWLLPWLARIDLGAVRKLRGRLARQASDAGAGGDSSSAETRGASRPT